MATTKTTPHEFIQQTLAPLIAVASSQGVEEISRKNNLDFVTLLQPFSKSTVEGKLLRVLLLSIPESCFHAPHYEQFFGNNVRNVFFRSYKGSIRSPRHDSTKSKLLRHQD